MSVRITISSITPPGVPPNGWKVGYKILGSGAAYTIAGPFMALPIQIDTTDPAGTLYEGYVTRLCAPGNESPQLFYQTPCGCAPGFTISSGGLDCEKPNIVPATVTS